MAPTNPDAVINALNLLVRTRNRPKGSRKSFAETAIATKIPDAVGLSLNFQVAAMARKSNGFKVPIWKEMIETEERSNEMTSVFDFMPSILRPKRYATMLTITKNSSANHTGRAAKGTNSQEIK